MARSLWGEPPTKPGSSRQRSIMPDTLWVPSGHVILSWPRQEPPSLEGSLPETPDPAHGPTPRWPEPGSPFSRISGGGGAAAPGGEDPCPHHSDKDGDPAEAGPSPAPPIPLSGQPLGRSGALSSGSGRPWGATAGTLCLLHSPASAEPACPRGSASPPGGPACSPAPERSVSVSLPYGPEPPLLLAPVPSQCRVAQLLSDARVFPHLEHLSPPSAVWHSY